LVASDRPPGLVARSFAAGVVRWQRQAYCDRHAPPSGNAHGVNP
jgi:hypothetical protein